MEVNQYIVEYRQIRKCSMLWLQCHYIQCLLFKIFSVVCNYFACFSGSFFLIIASGFLKVTKKKNYEDIQDRGLAMVKRWKSDRFCFKLNTIFNFFILHFLSFKQFVKEMTKKNVIFVTNVWISV